MFTKYNEKIKLYMVETYKQDESWEEIIYENNNVVYPAGLKKQFENDMKNEILYNRIQQAKAYLETTDFKVLPDYDEDATEVKLKRKEAREFIRANEIKELK